MAGSRRQFTVSPAPLQSPWTLGPGGQLSNPEWIAWFQRTLFPALANSGDLSLGDVLQFQRSSGEDARAAAADSLNLSATARPNTLTADPGSLAIWAAICRSADPSWVIVDTHANRTNYPNAVYEPGTLFVESDRLLLYRNTGAAWVYVAGTYSAALASLPALGANDAGALFSVTDYGHLLRWSGTAWGWGPGESGSGYFQDFAVAPTGAGWHLCDGSSGVTYLKSDGTTGTVTLPNTNGSAAYRKSGGAYASAITAAAVPSIPASVTTAVGAAVSGSTDVDSGAGQAVQSGSGATVAAHTHTHSAGSLAADAHQHGYGGINTSLGGGDPVANYEAITYFRQ